MCVCMFLSISDTLCMWDALLRVLERYVFCMCAWVSFAAWRSREARQTGGLESEED